MVIVSLSDVRSSPNRAKLYLIEQNGARVGEFNHGPEPRPALSSTHNTRVIPAGRVTFGLTDLDLNFCPDLISYRAVC